MKKHILFFVHVYLLSISFSFAQNWPGDTIRTSINSGNPKFPFPQFNEYTFGKSLAKYNAEGVTHADMEKSMKEAYKMMMHRSLYTGQTYSGKKYIAYNTDAVPANFGTFVSEGDGYALLAAAYFADKETFDGLWIWVHDNRLSKVKKYYDCLDLRPGHAYGALPGWNAIATDAVASSAITSATDGDQDIAMALLLAYKQWGDNMGINDACGTPISYKQEALKIIMAIADTLYYSASPTGSPAGTKGYLTGDIGIDGYIKNGNTSGELTTWRSSAGNTSYPWAKPIPDPMSTANSQFVDYMAPAYYHEFAQFLNANGGTPWQINQFKRAEASSDWVMGEMYKKGYIASAGNYTVNNDGSVTTFSSFSGGEDFRTSWRTILNYVWHGNPDSTWNPVTHQKIAVPNTYEYDMGVRHASFLKFPRTLPSAESAANCGKLGPSPDPSCPNWKGVAQLKQGYAPNGAVTDNFPSNYMMGTGTPAAVASGDLNLTAELYRQCEITWDDALSKASGITEDERYIKSTPKYFHDWFRLLGMLTASGNLQSPASLTPAANVKVYLSVDKTFAYEGDLVTYTVSYRNYGTVSASGVSIATSLDNNYQFVSATNGGVVSGNKIVWNIGNVQGFTSTAGIAATQGIVKFTVKVKSVSNTANACLISTITATNAPSWTSNQYPNNATYTMERNCVDLLPGRTLSLKKTTDRAVMNPGDVINVKLTFANQAMANGLTGGRDRVVISYANYLAGGTSFYQFLRVWHSAPEAYINLSNYRVTYFANDVASIGTYNASTNPTGWKLFVDNNSDLNKYKYNPLTLPANQQIGLSSEKMSWGVDANGSWNQRIVTQFANVLTAPSSHIYDKLDSEYLIHKGVTGPGFLRTRLESTPAYNLSNRVTDDWSYSNSVAISNIDGQANRYFPVSPVYTNSSTGFAPVDVNTFSKDVCDANVPNFSKVLVEEFDGYTWRKIAGNAPQYGIESNNVLITDTIHKNFTWKGFKDSTALGIKATYTPALPNANYTGLVTWTIPVMYMGALDTLSYQLLPKAISCPGSDVNIANAAWISSQTNAPISSSVGFTISCTLVPPTQPVETSLVKRANKTVAKGGETISYTLTFTNKTGSTGEWKGTNTLSTEWQAAGTAVLPKLNGATIALDQNYPGNPSTNGVGYGFEHTKVHGVNGWIESTIDVTNSSTVSFFFRHSAGTPGQANFQGVRLEIAPNPQGVNSLNLSVYNNATLVITQTNIGFGGSSDPIKFRVELQEDKMYIWTNDFTTAPVKTIAGITSLGAGYSGIFASISQQSITSWKGHFDSAFDLVISDPLPTSLSTITNISNAGSLSGGTITWPTVAGPTLAGTVFTRTFDAVVNTCKDFIVNVGNASTFGVTNIPSQSIVNCGMVTEIEREQGNQSHTVFPNPFSQILHIESTSGIHLATIKSAEGKILIQRKTNEQLKMEIQDGLEKLPVGLYFLELELSKDTKVRYKIMKAE